MRPIARSRIAGIVLTALLGGQILFGAAAVAAVVMKRDGRPAAEAPRMASTVSETVVR